MIFRPGRCDLCEACLEACQHDAITWSMEGPLTDREACQRCGACAEVCYSEARQMVGKPMSLPEVMIEINQDLTFYEGSGGGVTLSGGEPLFQKDFALAILKACREQDIHTVLDTCGYASWQAFEQVAPFVDLFLYDLKAIDPVKHLQYTGQSNERILVNLERLSRSGASLLVRIPVIPGLNANEFEMKQIGEYLSTLPQPPPVELLAYHNIAEAKYAGLDIPYALPKLKAPSPLQMTSYADLLRGFGLQVK
jgi:pyruvate formate lyase activating enzyme